MIGAVPLALPTGPGFETRQPMAFAILGGTILSTILSLYVVPCAYSLFARLEKKDYGEHASREAKVAEVQAHQKMEENKKLGLDHNA